MANTTYDTSDEMYNRSTATDWSGYIIAAIIAVLVIGFAVWALAQLGDTGAANVLPAGQTAQ